MKKIITAVLALAMVLSMGTMSAFAATDTMTATGNKNIDVKAVYNDKVSIPTVYSVDLTWGTMEFTYTATGTKTWNPSTNQYDINTNAVWTESGNDITVKNNSNTAVTASFAFAPLATYNTVTGSFSNTSVSLAAADKENVAATELTGSTALTLDGTLDKAVNTLTNVGKITVTIE